MHTMFGTLSLLFWWTQRRAERIVRHAHLSPSAYWTVMLWLWNLTTNCYRYTRLITRTCITYIIQVHIFGQDRKCGCSAMGGDDISSMHMYEATMQVYAIIMVGWLAIIKKGIIWLNVHICRGYQGCIVAIVIQVHQRLTMETAVLR